MDDTPSIKLYKYYSFIGCDIDKDYNIDALKKGYWYFGTPEYRNDPFDCCSEIYKSIIGRDLNGQEEDWIKKFGACCFTKSPINLHLWALYADSHKGFVLEFEFTEDDYINMTARRRINLPIFDMTYSEGIPTKDEIDFEELQSKRYFASELNGMSHERLIVEQRDLLWYLAHSLKQKSVWEAEAEVRMLLGVIRPYNDIPGTFETQVDGDKIKGYKVFYPKHCLKKCIAGLSISDENLEAIKSVTTQLGIPLTRMVKGKPFSLIEQPI